MTKPISGRPPCAVCGGPTFRGNTTGVCKRTPECRREYKARMREKHATPPPAVPSGEIGYCGVCGAMLHRRNTTGICRTGNPGCVRARAGKAGLPVILRPECGHPDCKRLSQRGGYCQMHSERLQRTGELGPGESRRKPLGVLSGTSFGRWTTLEDSPPGSASATLCRCDCGAERRILTDSLKRGASRSCGCLQREITSSRFSEGLYLHAGDVFGRLTLLEDAVRSLDQVRCRCECGKKTAKTAGHVKRGNVRSCGCLARETLRTHGLSSHPLYYIWHGMVARTTDPRNHAYEDYGARGIGVCERWRGLPDGLLNFAADMGLRPGPEYSVERIDNDGPYSTGNCRWGTKAEQSRNKRRVGVLTSERDALAAEVERLKGLLAAGRAPGDGDVL